MSSHQLPGLPQFHHPPPSRFLCKRQNQEPGYLGSNLHPPCMCFLASGQSLSLLESLLSYLQNERVGQKDVDFLF